MTSGTKIVPSVLLPALLAGLALGGCVKHVQMIAIPEKDASPPKLVWEVYNMQTKETKAIDQDGQSFVVAPGDLYVVTLAAEDLESGVKEVSLTGNADFKCEQGGKVEEKKYPLETQTQKASPDYDKKVPIKAGLTLSVDQSKHGCTEHQRFDGGTISLTGKAQNSLNGAGTKALRITLQPRPSS